MPGLVFVVLAVLTIPASWASAEELVLGLDTRTAWDDNVFFTAEEQQDDLSVRTGPIFELLRRRGDLRYGLGYRPVYEGFLHLDGIGAFEHLAYLEGTWRPRDGTELTFRDDFNRVRDLSRRLETVDPVGGAATELEPDVEIARSRTLRNALNLGLTHALSPRWRAGLTLSSQLFEFSDEERFDSLSLAGEASLTYALSPRDGLGFGVGLIRQDFDDTDFQAGSTTSYYQAFGAWTHQFDPTWSLSLQAGPTWVEPDSGDLPAILNDQPEIPFVEASGRVFVRDITTCPTLSDGTPFLGATGSCALQGPLSDADAETVRKTRTDLTFLPGRKPSDPDGSLTFFGQGTLTKSWKRMSASLSYLRTAGTVSGSNASTDLDSVSGRLVWRPSRRWMMSLVGSWDRRRSSTEQTFTVLALEPATVSGLSDVARVLDGGTGALRAVDFDDALDISQVRFEGRASRRVTKRTTLFAIASWLRQRSKGDLQGETSEIDRFRLILGFRWEIEPFHL